MRDNVETGGAIQERSGHRCFSSYLSPSLCVSSRLHVEMVPFKDSWQREELSPDSRQFCSASRRAMSWEAAVVIIVCDLAGQLFRIEQIAHATTPMVSSK